MCFSIKITTGTLKYPIKRKKGCQGSITLKINQVLLPLFRYRSLICMFVCLIPSSHTVQHKEVPNFDIVFLVYNTIETIFSELIPFDHFSFRFLFKLEGSLMSVNWIRRSGFPYIIWIPLRNIFKKEKWQQGYTISENNY